MKVALVMERLEPWRGGAETSTGQFMRHLVELGVRLEVVTRSQLSSSPGMTVHTVGVSGVTRSGRSAAFARAVDRSPSMFLHRRAAVTGDRSIRYVRSEPLTGRFVPPMNLIVWPNRRYARVKSTRSYVFFM